MKPFFSKTLDVITFGTLRRRRATTNDWVDTHLSLTQSLPPYHHPHSSSSLSAPTNPAILSIEVGGETGSWSIYDHAASSPPPERFDSLEDDVIFCKNNVYLKHLTPPTCDHTSSYSGNTPDRASPKVGGASPKVGGGSPKVSGASNGSATMTEVNLISGYMNLCTRGSDFSQTLILNWTPNHHMKRQSADEEGHMTLGDLSESPKSEEASSNGNGKQQFSNTVVSPMSLNLGKMESIHIFYHCDGPSGGITRGELIISDKERKLTMFLFEHQGLFDLLKKFRSWPYFSYKHYSEAKEYIFNVTRPRLTLSELHIEEGLVNGILTENMWSQLQDPVGRILDRKLVLQVSNIQ